MSAKILYTWVYPTRTVDGDHLITVEGALIQLKRPGKREYEDVAFVQFPQDETVLEIKESGAYGIRHVIRSKHSQSQPSEASALFVDCRVPSQPVKGSVDYVCPVHHT